MHTCASITLNHRTPYGSDAMISKTEVVEAVHDVCGCIQTHSGWQTTAACFFSRALWGSGRQMRMRSARRSLSEAACMDGQRKGNQLPRCSASKEYGTG
jgi:hypothetical protein